jgi:hypothetical protein
MRIFPSYIQNVLFKKGYSLELHQSQMMMKLFSDYTDHDEHFVCWDRTSEMNASRDNTENVKYRVLTEIREI